MTKKRDLARAGREAARREIKFWTWATLAICAWLVCIALKGVFYVS